MSVPTEKELMQLKELTRMTGSLSNVQIKQLKMWSAIVLGALGFEVEVDTEGFVVVVDATSLDYPTMMKDTTEDPVTMYRRRMARFDYAVKWLLGEDYAVVIRLKGNQLGSFPPKSPPLLAHLPKELKK